MIQEFLIIFIINYIGIILTEVLNLPIPGTISGMLAAEYDNIFYASFCKTY